ncbi:MAG: N-6 DNA methylase [Endomicrobiia bacterium]
MNKNIEKFKNLLIKEISHLNNKVVKIENNRLSYFLKNQYYRNISSCNQNVLGELGRARAILHLVTEQKVPPNLICLEETSLVGSPSKRVDIKIETADNYNERSCIALVECKTSIYKISDKEFTNYFIRQLYNIAHSYAKNTKQPYPLTLIMYEISLNNSEKIDIFYRWFSYPEIEKTIETGQISLEEIISKNSSFAYKIPPKVSDNKVYFHKMPLTKNDLIDIKNPNEFKNMLKEKLHQGLRNYGIVEEKAFETIINLLLAKTFDEIELLKKGNEEPCFQVRPEDYLNKTAFYNRIKSLLENALIQLLGEDPKEARDKELIDHEDKEKILLDVVLYLQRMKLRSLRFVGEDSVGDVFLDFMHSIFRQSRALFFTHPNICRFVCKALNIQKLGEEIKKKNYKYILDPSCGSGTFLIEALRLIFKDYQIEDIKENALKIIFGIDNEQRATSLCKVNMVIHGDGSANIYTRDALLPLDSLPLPFIKETYILRNGECTPESIKENHGVDFIITNPPFSLEIRQDGYSNFRMKEFLSFKRGITNASECIFAERWYQLLNPKGKLGAVLPFSIFDSNEYFKAKLLFLSYFKIIAIIGLPEHAFAPHAQQRTLLVFAERRSLEESNQLFYKINKIDEFIDIIKNEKIIFYDAKNIGYVRTKKKKTVNTIQIKKNDLTDELAEIISSAFDGKYRECLGITIKTLEEIYTKRKFILTPTFSEVDNRKISSSKALTISQEWEIVEVERINGIDINNLSLLICETGDIVPGGAGIITPKNLIHTTASNIERIKRKIASGKFGTLKEGDIIIAPVRIYQKKIAVVTKSATKFLFSKDFIVLRRKNKNLKESFFLFLSLIHDANIRKLEDLSSTGKSGYPKIKNKKSILQTKFYKVKISPQKIEKLINLYDEIYKYIFKN